MNFSPFLASILLFTSILVGVADANPVSIAQVSDKRSNDPSQGGILARRGLWDDLRNAIRDSRFPFENDEASEPLLRPDLAAPRGDETPYQQYWSGFPDDHPVYGDIPERIETLGGSGPSSPARAPGPSSPQVAPLHHRFEGFDDDDYRVNYYSDGSEMPAHGNNPVLARVFGSARPANDKDLVEAQMEEQNLPPEEPRDRTKVPGRRVKSSPARMPGERVVAIRAQTKKDLEARLEGLTRQKTDLLNQVRFVAARWAPRHKIPQPVIDKYMQDLDSIEDIKAEQKIVRKRLQELADQPLRIH